MSEIEATQKFLWEKKNDLLVSLCTLQQTMMDIELDGSTQYLKN